MVFYHVSWFSVSWVFRALWRLRVEGRKHLPRKGPAILASNHLSFLDHFLLGASTRRQVFFISKVQHFEKPLRRFLFKQWGVIPLRRGEGDKSAFEASVRLLHEGRLYAIYPEGTRSLDGKLHKGHTGVARLHLLTGAPIVPVAMIGTYEALPKGRSRPRLTKCTVRYGPPLDFSHLKDKAGDRATLRRVTDQVMQAIQRLSGQEYTHEYQYNPEVKTHRTPGPS